MDILIELIVWIFKAFFGEQEKPADLTPTARKPAPRRQRGPLTYGDESGSQPKTLEEILQEARRQAQAKRGASGPGPTPTNAVRPAPQRDDDATRKARRVSAEAPVAPTSAPPVRELVGAPLTPIDRLTPLRALNDQEQMGESKDIQWSSKRREPDKAGPRKSGTIVDLKAQTPAPAPERIPEQPRTTAARTAAAAVRTADLAAYNIVKAIRAAKPAQKSAVARQGMIMYEVFGPPRAMRPHRPGQR